jgi:hypothetical protein
MYTDYFWQEFHSPHLPYPHLQQLQVFAYLVPKEHEEVEAD